MTKKNPSRLELHPIVFSGRRREGATEGVDRARSRPARLGKRTREYSSLLLSFCVLTTSIIQQIQQDWAESAMPPPGAGDIGGLGAGVAQIAQVEDWSAAPPPTQQQGADEWKTGNDDWGASGGASGWN